MTRGSMECMSHSIGRKLRLQGRAWRFLSIANNEELLGKVVPISYEMYETGKPIQ